MGYPAFHRVFHNGRECMQRKLKLFSFIVSKCYVNSLAQVPLFNYNKIIVSTSITHHINYPKQSVGSPVSSHHSVAPVEEEWV